MLCIDDYNFNITYDFYKNRIWVKPLNDKYNTVIVNISDQDKNVLYSETITINVGLTYWFEPSEPFTNFNEIIIDVVDSDNTIITTETIKVKTENGIIIKPVILRIANKVGMGDQMWLSPSIRKLYTIYGRKVIISSHRENYIWGNYLYETYKEFLKNNRYINYFIDSEDIDNEDMYDIFEGYPSGGDYVWLDLKKLVSLPFNFLLNDDELYLDYVPDKYVPIENLPEKYVCINPYVTGIERSWEKEKWQELVDLLNKQGIYVVSIGVQKYYNLDIKLGLDLAGVQYDMSQTWHIINKSGTFISFDCGVYILAGTTNTKIVLLGWKCDEKLHQPKKDKFSCVRGNCDIYCGTDIKSIFDKNGTLKIINSYPNGCPLNKNYGCKPTPKQVFNSLGILPYLII